MTKTLDHTREAHLRAYAIRSERHRVLKAAALRAANRIALLRLLAFLGAAVGIVGGLGRFFSWPLFSAALGGLAALGFILLVVRHAQVHRAQMIHAHLEAINEEGIHRMERHWQALPHVPPPPDRAEHPVARDLDLFAVKPKSAALFQLLSPLHTDEGLKQMAQWLLEASPLEAVALRQSAVEALGDKTDWREKLTLLGRLLPSPKPNIAAFLEWAGGNAWLAGRPLLLLSARILSLLPTLFLLLYLMGLIPPLFVLFAAVNLAFFALVQRRCHAAFERVSVRGHAFRSYGELFLHLSEIGCEDAMLKRLTAEMGAEGVTAFRQMKRLDQLSSMADARFSPMIYIPLQAMCLSSIHVLHGLEKWQQCVGKRVPKWFDAMGALEAISALATLRYDNPDWVFPSVRDEAQAMHAVSLGHPLLAPDACTVNDIIIGPAGSFQMITGSNMSGKSTLLRAVGLNVLLARAGGAIFAATCEMPPLALATSFRIQDSLEHGVSFFLAELKRLKEIVDAAVLRGAAGQPFLYLLDEILQGTNVRERRIAVERVVQHLLENGAIGAISTHDLGLAESSFLKGHCHPFYFTETYEEKDAKATMRFDYRLRPGIAPTVNALRLLDLVGITERGYGSR